MARVIPYDGDREVRKAFGEPGAQHQVGGVDEEDMAFTGLGRFYDGYPRFLAIPWGSGSGGRPSGLRSGPRLPAPCAGDWPSTPPAGQGTNMRV